METNTTTTSITSKTTRRSISFENLSQELEVDIFHRLPVEDLSSVMWISKHCYNLVVNRLLPNIAAPFRRQFDAMLLHLEIDETRSPITPRAISVISGPTNVHYNDLLQQLHWCYRMVQCRNIDGGEKLVDCCNGLFLFCHKGGNPEILFSRHYYYYVMNPITKQCIAILKPDAGNDTHTNAALAYHPNESNFFTIVQYRGTDTMKVFSSKNREWLSLDFELLQQVTRATWEMKCVYCRGAVIRISNSGHLLKFLVDLQEYIEDQAMAIELPEECQVLNAIKDHHIIMAFSRGNSILIWVLNEIYGGGEYTYSWDLQYALDNVIFRPDHR